ncbi:MAG: WXG100 family type VII secretion target [Chloroflexi bacterium]|nr:MAG: WXG100 family type VII secretion target [Chloroflexota bacterium]
MGVFSKGVFDMALLRQDIETIRTLAAQIAHERNDTVENLLGRLNGINEELNAAWDGPSQIAFQEAYGDWIQQLRKYSDTLNNVHQYLTSVAQNFEDLDAAAAAAASGAAAPV